MKEQDVVGWTKEIAKDDCAVRLLAKHVKIIALEERIIELEKMITVGKIKYRVGTIRNIKYRDHAIELERCGNLWSVGVYWDDGGHVVKVWTGCSYNAYKDALADAKYVIDETGADRIVEWEEE